HTPYSTHFLSLLFYTVTTPSDISTLSLHDALPISSQGRHRRRRTRLARAGQRTFRQRQLRAGYVELDEWDDPLHRQTHRRDPDRSEEHTSELQSRENLVCRLLLEKKKKREHI